MRFSHSLSKIILLALGSGCSLSSLVTVIAADPPPSPSSETGSLSDRRFDEQRGLWVSQLTSEYQATPSEVEILLPQSLQPGRRYPVLYLLPVGKRGGEFGDPMVEAKNAGLADKLGMICVSPSFSIVPWYGNHASDPAIRQEEFILRVLVPYIDSQFPTLAKPEGRWLIGFSKSGWGAVTLLLRHPEIFGFAAAWDAPFMLDGAQGKDWGPMGLRRVFGTKEKMLEFLPTGLAVQKGKELGDKVRLIIAPGNTWKGPVEKYHAFLEKNHVPHAYRSDLLLPHRWDSGWFVPMVEDLRKLAQPLPEK